MSRVIAFVFCLLVPFTAAAQSGDPTVDFAGDPAMSSAMNDAVRTLPLFLENAVDAEGFSVPSALVKVSFEVSGGTEVIWIGPFAVYGDGTMAGLLANQPNHMPGLNAGDPVSFSRDMIRDWAITMPDGLLWGHYTTRTIVATLPPAQAAPIAESLSKTPIPLGW